MAQAVITHWPLRRRGPGAIPGQSYETYSAKCSIGTGFTLGYVGFLSSALFRRCSILIHPSITDAT